ncbi:MAG: ABC transporter ATP-binding protein [Lachnospiraceae bacterium]|nr:ABC transporter ATP-binding protein [Lachnospiraceae bacterium]
MQVLRINNIRKTYYSKRKITTEALKGVSFAIEDKEMVAIMGSSGSDKTTLMNILTGLLEPDDGEIIIGDEDLLTMPKDRLALLRRKHIGIVFQNYNLLDSLTVRENIEVPLILDYYDGDKEDKVRKVAAFMGMEQQLDKYPYEISGGQQQRVGICRAIINNAKVIFADEPTGNLDSKSSKKVMEYFQMVCKEMGTSILLVTHDPVIASYCNRVLFIQDGKIENEIVKEKGENMYEKIIEAQRGILQ